MGFTSPYRTIDGSGNNFGGQTDVQLQRGAFNGYEDLISAPAGSNAASAREISNAVAAQAAATSNAKRASDLFWLWGQFLDHDIDLTESAVPAEALPISVPIGDPQFDPGHTGHQTIPLDRSAYDPNSGTSTGNPRQQLNHITAFIDASNVYGSDSVRAAALRTFVDGRLATSAGDFLPFNVLGLANAGGTSASLFLAGDVRANEHVGLTAMHTLFVREHNRRAAELQASDPGLNDEALYQQARAYVGALMQVITYREFLPILLGDQALAAHQGHDPLVDPGVHNFFSTAAYRLGHSMINSRLLRLDSSGAPVADGNLQLRDAFFAPHELSSAAGHGIDEILRGFTRQTAQAVDTQVVDELRNFLFGPPGAGGFDLASLNIQRGRDHGLPRYNEARVLYGLPAVQSFSEITSDPGLQADLALVYANVDEIDPWVGGLAEDHVADALVGPLFHAALTDQFTRLRDGDAFWYTSQCSGALLAEIEATRLRDIIARNTTVGSSELQSSVLLRPRFAELALDVCEDDIARVHIALPSGPQIPTAATVAGELVSDGGSRVSIEPVAGNLLRPGVYNIEWQVALTANDMFTIDQTLVVSESSSVASCCPADGVHLTGTSNSDFIVRGLGLDYRVDAGDGSDIVFITGGDNCILGGEGGDLIVSRGQTHKLHGGQGNDWLTCGSGGHIQAWAGPGDDRVSASGCGSAEIYGGGGEDSLTGSDGDDIIYPGSGRNSVDAGAGDDEVVITASCELTPATILDGGDGSDTLRTPVPLAALQAAGVTVRDFETVVVDDSQAHLADCHLAD